MSAALNAEADRLFALMQAGGAQVFETTILQPSDVLLDLYGENIHARAFVTSDPVLGEQMLRPDFTVPVVQHHMAEGATPARYCYKGVVFRKQKAASERPSETLQVGYELFEDTDPAAADADVFALFVNALSDYKVRPVMGDIGVLMAAVNGLDTSQVRRAALLRHIWRPARFEQLLDRFSAASATPPPAHASAPHIGLRSADEIATRLAALEGDRATPPISDTQRAAINALLAIDAPAPAALAELRAIAKAAPNIEPAISRLSQRLEAMSAKGIDVEGLRYSGSFGRLSLEYYDGFVFGFEGGNALVASGGRYDALTQFLGQGRGIPAVGGVIRPAELLALKAGTL